MTISGTGTTGTHHRPTHARLSPNRQIPPRIPLILDIVWRPLEMPISEISTALDLLFQAASIRTQLCVREVLAANLKPIQYQHVRNIAAVLVGFLGRRLHRELPPLGVGVCAAEFVVVGVVKWIVAVAVVDDDFELSYAVVDG